MDAEQQFNTLLSVAEECLDESSLRKLLEAKPDSFVAYDGFEPSGRMHIAQGIFKAVNVNKITKSGGTFLFWVADWFALMNDKMGGDLEKIKVVGEYLQEVWTAAGMNHMGTRVKFILCSECITGQAEKYWLQVLDVARRFNVTRIKKCCQIMGRLENSLSSAQILYPLMQCADIFFLNADICQLGLDQRKVNTLALEYCSKVNRKIKPVILSHHMLMGLKQGQAKMSKSDPDSAIFMEDSAEDVCRKIKNSYCPTAIEGDDAKPTSNDMLKNPCLDYIQNILFNIDNFKFQIPSYSLSDDLAKLSIDDALSSTTTAFNKVYASYQEVFDAFISGEMTTEELKCGLIYALNTLLQPIRTHFTQNERAKTILAQIVQWKKEGTVKSNNGDIAPILPEGITSNATVITLPLCSHEMITLTQVVNVAQAIAQNSTADRPIVLLEPDWASFATNSLLDMKIIHKYYALFEFGVKCALSELGVTEAKYQILKQSELILNAPSEYWLCVMNAGRSHMLNDIMGESLEDSDGSGNIVHRLMRVADVTALKPTVLATQLDDLVTTAAGVSGVEVVELNAVDLRLKAEKEIGDLNFEYLINDTDKVAKSKMKKSFCEPGNVEFCPAIEFVKVFRSSNFEVVRTPENGGNVTYTDPAQLSADFKSEKLHPGDLKSAVGESILIGLLSKLDGGIKESKELKDALKGLKALEKKAAKAKK
eukprot:CAMPEP_0196802594 /NCGR_PEP_ID=MMETSP1362-20130617/2179_1 /TAXON_ID=163516 /ORGANISM="Leptocylindrus danicus, Strain CCMP1856" /LENGTH=707 /DNA_ID=CAMNT_0042173931 /DNA_START=29 /DNA_END=2152 /DNA_ORIENTATION=+